jgi:hypothetical protein
MAKIIKISNKHRMCNLSAFLILDFHKNNSLDLPKIEGLLQSAKNFDMSLKKGFQCLFCDYDNVIKINEELRFVKYGLDFCVEIVRNTIEYYELFRTLIWKYINTVDILAHCVNDENFKEKSNFDFDEEQGLEFLGIEASIYDDSCFRAFQSNNVTQIEQMCVNYCSRYDLWKYGGVFPNIETLSKIYKNVQERLMKNVKLNVQLPNEEYSKYYFTFDNSDFDFFTEYENVFVIDGIGPDKILEVVI